MIRSIIIIILSFSILTACADYSAKKTISNAELKKMSPEKLAINAFGTQCIGALSNKERVEANLQKGIELGLIQKLPVEKLPTSFDAKEKVVAGWGITDPLNGNFYVLVLYESNKCILALKGMNPQQLDTEYAIFANQLNQQLASKLFYTEIPKEEGLIKAYGFQLPNLAVGPAINLLVPQNKNDPHLLLFTPLTIVK